MRKPSDWIAFGALLAAVFGGAMLMASRLGAAEERLSGVERQVGALVARIDLIAPPTVRPVYVTPTAPAVAQHKGP